MRKNSLINRLRSVRSKGIAALELALIFPLALSIALGGAAFARGLKIDQSLSMISRQAASSAFRDAALQYRGDATVVQGLLDGLFPDMERFARTALPGSGVILSVYRYVPSTGTAALVARSGSAGFTSRYSTSTVLGEVSALKDNNRLVAISEIFYPDANVNALLARFYRGDYYESTIF